MRRLLHTQALLLGLTLLAAEPASAAHQHGQKVASGSSAVVELLALENAPLSAERTGENVALSYESASGSPVAARGVGALSPAGQVADRAGLTRAGRALAKHGGREGSVFPRATGNPGAINTQGQAALDDILGNVAKSSPNKYGGVDHFGGRFGGGARYDEAGNFMGFLEP